MLRDDRHALYRLRIALIALPVWLLTACGGTPVAPTLTVTPSLTPPVTLIPTVPSDTPDFQPFITSTPDPTHQATESGIPPVIQTNFGAPVKITVPETWQTASAAIQMPDGGTTAGLVPFTVYRGPITGGIGEIVIVWGFRNVTSAPPPGLEDQAPIYLRGDGIRLLTLAIFDPGCNIGVDVDREFKIGEQFGTGAFFAATECPALADGTPALPDTRGWFVVTQQGDPETGVDANIAFFVYTTPAEALEGPALNELQAIMDTVVFDFTLEEMVFPLSPVPTFETLTPAP